MQWFTSPSSIDHLGINVTIFWAHTDPSVYKSQVIIIVWYCTFFLAATDKHCKSCTHLWVPLEPHAGTQGETEGSFCHYRRSSTLCQAPVVSGCLGRRTWQLHTFALLLPKLSLSLIRSSLHPKEVSYPTLARAQFTNPPGIWTQLHLFCRHKTRSRNKEKHFPGADWYESGDWGAKF